MNENHQDILLEVGALPTAPFVEGAVHGYIRRFVESRGHLRLEVDRYRNLLVHYSNSRSKGGQPRNGRPELMLAAHTDHPGFVAERMTGPNKLRARWFGGVKLDVFKNADVRFYAMSRPDQQAGQCHVERVVPGRITSVVTVERDGEARPHLRRRAEAVYVEVAEPVPSGSPGMWYLPDPRIVGAQVIARAHDDLAQVAAMLCLLDQLGRDRVFGHVTCAFTRAEEVGFAGAIGLALDGAVPANAVFISLEASDAVAAGANLGDGPALRVGDLATTFDQATLSWMGQVARDVAGLDKDFRWQRKLMPGGTCESTPFAVFGYATGAICLPLLNYHNMGPGKRAESEIIDLADFENEVNWLVALVEQFPHRQGVNRELGRKLKARLAENRPFFRKWMK